MRIPVYSGKRYLLNAFVKHDVIQIKKSDIFIFNSSYGNHTLKHERWKCLKKNTKVTPKAKTFLLNVTTFSEMKS